MSSSSQPAAATSTRLYRAIWRWHFYAGMLVVPFLIVLAVTGLIMVYGNSIESFLGPKHSVAAGGERASLASQAAAAQAAIPGGATKMIVIPAAPDRATQVVVTAADLDHVVSVDPNGARVIGSVVKDDTWFYWASTIHGTLMLGDTGDRILEVAAGLGVILVLTGLYLWWPRNARTLGRALLPLRLSPGRGAWRDLHASAGFYMSIALLFFFISGLAWTGVWGSKIVQAWSTFPAEKWDSVPVSDKTHASMNHGSLKEVPWALEQTPLPVSGSDAGVMGLPVGTPVTVDTVAAFARSIGFDEQFRINVPRGEEGVFTVSADSMDGDTTSPTGDRTVHIDQYSGKILADVRFADYSAAGKAMAVGIALHQANLGVWNTVLNVVLCLGVLFIAVSGVVMWWHRRPVGTLGVPLYPKNFRVPAALLGATAVVVIAFPLTGLAIIALGILDFLLPKSWKEAGFQGA